MENSDQTQTENIDETEQTEEESNLIKKINKLISTTYNKLNESIVIMNSDIEARIKIEF